MNVWDRALSSNISEEEGGDGGREGGGGERRSVTEFPKASLVTEGYLAGDVWGRRELRDRPTPDTQRPKLWQTWGLAVQCGVCTMLSVDLHLYVCTCRRRGLRPRPVSLVHTCHRVSSTSEAGPPGGSRGALVPVAHGSPPLLHFIALRR